MPLKDLIKRKEYRKAYTLRTKEQKKEYDKIYVPLNRKRISNRASKWNKNNPEKHSAHLKKWLAANPDKRKSIFMKNKRGITLDDYNLMFKEQCGCCFICGTHQTALKRALHIDHCHITGRVRKLLCQHCNSMLGFAKDNIEILQSAIKYLSK